MKRTENCRRQCGRTMRVSFVFVGSRNSVPRGTSLMGGSSGEVQPKDQDFSIRGRYSQRVKRLNRGRRITSDPAPPIQPLHTLAVPSTNTEVLIFGLDLT